MDGTVIVADDDRTIRTVIGQALTRAGCRVKTTSTISTLWQWVEAGEGDVVVSDVMMPDGNTLDILPAIRKKRPNLPVILMSAQNTVVTAVRATENGAYEYFPKPFDLNAMLRNVDRALRGISNSKRLPSAVILPDVPALPLVGGSQAMQSVYRIIARLAKSDLNVFLTGETGTGKRLAAKCLHEFGPNASAPFVTVSFDGMSDDAFEIDLLGREDVNGIVPGKLEAADGGTVYFSSVGELPAHWQRRLSQILQQQSFRRVGGVDDIGVNFRVISSSSENMSELVHGGLFREDLYYRLNVVPVRMPSLSERIEDIGELVRHFLKSPDNGVASSKAMSKDALQLIKNNNWPGNVRELHNFVDRLALLSNGDVIEKDLVADELSKRLKQEADANFDNRERLSESIAMHLQRFFASHGDELPAPGLYQRLLRELEVPLFEITLAATQGNQIRAAELLGINRNTLRKKIKNLEIDVARGQNLM